MSLLQILLEDLLVLILSDFFGICNLVLFVYFNCKIAEWDISVSCCQEKFGDSWAVWTDVKLWLSWNLNWDSLRNNKKRMNLGVLSRAVR